MTEEEDIALIEQNIIGAGVNSVEGKVYCRLCKLDLSSVKPKGIVRHLREFHHIANTNGQEVWDSESQ